jgi:hypothetical protein
MSYILCHSIDSIMPQLASTPISRLALSLCLSVMLADGIGAQSRSAEFPKRSGLVLGFGLGVASVSQGQVSTLSARRGRDIALSWRVGYQVSDRVAVVLNGASSVYTYDGTGRRRRRGFEGIFPSVQYWVTPRFWLSTGAGLNLDAPAFYDVKPSRAGERAFYRGLGAIAMAGYDVHRTPSLAVDVQTRWHIGYADIAEGRRHGSSAALLLGVRRR